MKFAHSFTEELQSSKYPSEWRDAAIHYRELKKCIKKVQKELAELGLSADMLKLLAEHSDKSCAIQTPLLDCTSTPASCMPMDSTTPMHTSVSFPQHNNDNDSIASSNGDTGDFDKQGLQNRNQQCASKDVADLEEEEEEEEEEESCGKAVTFSYCFDGLLLYFSRATFRLSKYPLLLPLVCIAMQRYWQYIFHNLRRYGVLTGLPHRYPAILYPQAHSHCRLQSPR